MERPEARTQLLRQHGRLRELLGTARALATRLVAGESVEPDLAACLASLRDAFAEHNRTEEALLEPLLAGADAWGPARVARMLEEHVAEHRAMAEFLARPPADAAPGLADFAEQIEAHMDAEERTFLSAKVLC